MTLTGKPFGYRRTKFCFTYCGPERCNCGANDPFCADSPYFVGERQEQKQLLEQVKDEQKQEHIDGKV